MLTVAVVQIRPVLPGCQEGATRSDLASVDSSTFFSWPMRFMGYRLGIHASQGRANSDVDWAFRSNDLVRRRARRVWRTFREAGTAQVKGPPRKQTALDGAAAGQAGDGLEYNRLEHRGGDIFLLAPSFKKCLDIRFRKRRRSGLQ